MFRPCGIQQRSFRATAPPRLPTLPAAAGNSKGADSLNMNRGPFQAVIESKEQISPSTYMLTLQKPEGFVEAMPGQFVSIKIGDSTSPLLRRPFSIMDSTPGSLLLLVKDVGPGTSYIVSRKPSQTLDLIGPLGETYFDIPSGEDAVFVAGGTGLAPLVFTARKWAKDHRIGISHFLYGASTERELLTGICREDFTYVHVATLDGSEGFEGDVVKMFNVLREKGALPERYLFSCGPAGMVKKLMEGGTENFKSHQTSLETVMACGVGACRGCVVPLKSSGAPVYRAVCSEGTVFEADDIDWENWRE
ncbi:MAG: hypothetical protein GF417_06855 [Candidatus Latescibacteria bacterium]|nr:hypothetical protein [bacterium]MBD3424138.1 hypothetical protein [Candidatus Latescibacterota bacterium]